MIAVLSNAQLDAIEAQRRSAEQPAMVTGLAAYVRRCWEDARRYRIDVEERMLRNLRNRRGEYDSKKLAEIRAIGGSDVFMMLTSVKARAVKSWVNDVLLGEGTEKPWSVDASPVPELTEPESAALETAVGQKAAQFMAMGGVVDPEELRQAVQTLKDELKDRLAKSAKDAVQLAEKKLEDVLVEGKFTEAFKAFIDDLTVFPSAILKGPVIRRKPRLQWANGKPTVVYKLVREYERVDPLHLYPAKHAIGFDDGYTIERHRMTRRALEELKGVPGYNDAKINEVLAEYGRGGLREWLSLDSARQSVEQRVHDLSGPEATIDALQFWGSVPGVMLMEWGADDALQLDPVKEYDVETWLIGSHVIRAVLNPNPLGKKPYYKTSYETVPGSFWGNSPADLIVDCQEMCNAAARTLVNNIGMSSGPQVWVNNDRLPPGAKITQIMPWKVWQGTSDPMGSTAPAIEFFQPQPITDGLLRVFEFFSALADEYSGMPRYMTGSQNVGGAGRTATGLTTLVNNAGKGIKDLMRSIDIDVLTPMLEDLYDHLQIFEFDPEIAGDIRIVARGATYSAARESLMLRRNEFLQMTANPFDAPILGVEGRARLLREQARMLQLPVDDIIPSPERAAILDAIQAQLGAGGAGPAQQIPSPGGGQTLTNGEPVADQFQPAPVS